MCIQSGGAVSTVSRVPPGPTAALAAAPSVPSAPAVSTTPAVWAVPTRGYLAEYELPKC